jgi:hypothetical protein
LGQNYKYLKSIIMPPAKIHYYDTKLVKMNLRGNARGCDTRVKSWLKTNFQPQNSGHCITTALFSRLSLFWAYLAIYLYQEDAKLFIHWRKQPNTGVESECRVLWTFHTCIFLIQINREVCSEQRQPWKEGCSNTVSRILRLKIGFKSWFYPGIAPPRISP